MSKQRPRKIQGEQVREGRLVYLAAASSTVIAATPFGHFKLFKVTFGKDGSIYLPFPYLDTKRGVLSEADPETEPDPKKLNLRRNGIVVEYDVKFSHHISGWVQFSKTGEDALLPRRRSFPLNGPIGIVFDFRLYWLRGFAAPDPADSAHRDRQDRRIVIARIGHRDRPVGAKRRSWLAGSRVAGVRPQAFFGTVP